jgi:hypothetical protein
MHCEGTLTERYTNDAGETTLLKEMVLQHNFLYCTQPCLLPRQAFHLQCYFAWPE